MTYDESSEQAPAVGSPDLEWQALCILASLRTDDARRFASALSVEMFGGTTLWVARILLPLAMSGDMDPVSLALAIAKSGEDTDGTLADRLMASYMPASEETRDKVLSDLRTLAHKRTLIMECNAIASSVACGRLSAEDAEESLAAMRIRNAQTYAPPVPSGMMPSVAAFLDMQTEREARRESKTSLRTGFATIDQRAEIIPSYGVIAARTSVGKTGMAFQWALNAAAMGARPVFFSLEQPKEQIVTRALCTMAGRPVGEILNPRTAPIMQDMQRCLDWLAECGLTVIDGRHTLGQIQAKLMRMVGRGECDIAFIDQLSRIDHRPGRNESTEHAWSRTSDGIVALWKELKIPVVVLAQLNIKDSREHPVPAMSQLKNCGSIAEDCCWCWVIDRPEAEPERWAKMQAEMRKARAKGDEETAMRYDMAGRVEVTQQKDRTASMGGNWRLRIAFDSRTGTFGKWPPESLVSAARAQQSTQVADQSEEDDLI